MKKQGFTLIELLAVIVILAIIALIATPIVLNIIANTKENAQLRSAEMYIKGLETSIATATLKNKRVSDGSYTILNDGNICLKYSEENISVCSEELEVHMSGEVPNSGMVTIASGKIKDIELKYSNGKIIIMNNDGDLEYEVKLAAGLYDADGNMTVSWEQLTSLEYKSFTVIEWDMETSSLVEVQYPILIVDENGVLKGAWSTEFSKSLCSEYLIGHLVLPDSVTEIANDGFKDCKNLTGITFSNSVKTIGNNAFYRCRNLTSVEFSNSIKTIGNNAFYGCGNLTSIEFSNSIESIGDYAFVVASSNITSIIIPSNITTIGTQAFSFGEIDVNVYFEHEIPPTFGYASFYNQTPPKVTFHFKNQAVYDAFDSNAYGDMHNYIEKSTDFSW